MGLDMYLTGDRFHASSVKPRRKVDGFDLKEEKLELGYWRKHPNLHGYIVNEFAEGRDECQEIELSEEDLKTTINAVKTDALEFTEGFFFGVDATPDQKEQYEAQKTEDIQILEGALKWLTTKDEGIWKSVSYRASW